MSARTDQISAAEMKNMPADELVQALRAGQLDELLAGRDPGREPAEFVPPVDPSDQGYRGTKFANAAEWIRSLSPERVAELHREGHLDAILRGEVE